MDKNQAQGEHLVRLNQELVRYRRWVADLQSGMYVNCIYCGHRYPPGTPGVQADVLYSHIKECPEHPLSKAHDVIRRLREENERLRTRLGQGDDGMLSTAYHKVNGRRLAEVNAMCRLPTPSATPGEVLYEHVVHFNDEYRMVIQVVAAIEPHVEPAYAHGILQSVDGHQFGFSEPADQLHGEYMVRHNGMQFTTVVDSTGPQPKG